MNLRITMYCIYVNYIKALALIDPVLVICIIYTGQCEFLENQITN